MCDIMLQQFSYVCGKHNLFCAFMTNTCDCSWVWFLSSNLYIYIIMTLQTVSQNLKAQIPVLFFEQDFSVDQICAILSVKKSMVYKSLQYFLEYFHEYGISHNPHAHKTGRNQTLSHLDIKSIAALVDQKCCIYLNKICQELSKYWGCQVSISTVSCTLWCLDSSWKSVSIRAQEQSNILRAAYMNRIADIVTNPDMLMFIDEAAQKHGWTPLLSHPLWWSFSFSSLYCWLKLGIWYEMSHTQWYQVNWLGNWRVYWWPLPRERI